MLEAPPGGSRAVFDYCLEIRTTARMLLFLWDRKDIEFDDAH